MPGGPGREQQVGEEGSGSLGALASATPESSTLSWGLDDEGKGRTAGAGLGRGRGCTVS